MTIGEIGYYFFEPGNTKFHAEPFLCFDFRETHVLNGRFNRRHVHGPPGNDHNAEFLYGSIEKADDLFVSFVNDVGFDIGDK